MEREELAEVFYGTGNVPFPFATDCPVRFDAWLRFAQPLKRRGAAVDVILAVLPADTHPVSAGLSRHCWP